MVLTNAMKRIVSRGYWDGCRTAAGYVPLTAYWKRSFLFSCPAIFAKMLCELGPREGRRVLNRILSPGPLWPGRGSSTPLRLTQSEIDGFRAEVNKIAGSKEWILDRLADFPLSALELWSASPPKGTPSKEDLGALELKRKRLNDWISSHPDETDRLGLKSGAARIEWQKLAAQMAVLQPFLFEILDIDVDRVTRALILAQIASSSTDPKIAGYAAKELVAWDFNCTDPKLIRFSQLTKRALLLKVAADATHSEVALIALNQVLGAEAEKAGRSAFFEEYDLILKEMAQSAKCVEVRTTVVEWLKNAAPPSNTGSVQEVKENDG